MKTYYSTILFSCMLMHTSMAQNKTPMAVNPASYERLDMKSSPFSVSNSYLTKHDIVFLSPTQLEAEGFPMGNGNMGGMIWNHDNGIEIQINKNDLWTKPTKEADAAILKHAARLKIDFGVPVFSWIHLKDFTGRLSLQNGEASYNAATAYTNTNIKTWLAHNSNVWVIECENIPNEKFLDENILATISLERVGSRAFSRWYGGGFPKDAAVGLGNTKAQKIGNDMLIEEKSDGLNFTVACRILKETNTPQIISSHRSELKTGKHKFTILLSVVTDKENLQPKEAAIALLNNAEKTGVDKLKKEKDEWYTNFWSNSFVKLGNDYLENIYYLRRYLMAAGSQGEYPVSFNGGLWRWNRDVLNWITPHHWNTQQQYWGLAAENDCQLMRPYLNTYFKMIPYAEKLAKDNGAVNDALQITEAHDFDGLQVSQAWGNMNHNNSPAAQVAAIFWDYYDFTRDATFLRDTAYVFMKKAANYYLDKLQWDAAKKEYFIDGSLFESESITKVRNPINDRVLFESLFRNCITAATLLKTDADLVKRWSNVLNHLSPITFETVENRGEVISPAQGYYTKERYSPFGWASGGTIAFPAGLIGIDQKDTRLGKAVINFAKAQNDVNAHYPTPEVAARMGLGDQALTLLLNGVKIHQMYPQGLMHNVTGYPDNIYNLQSLHDMLDGKFIIRSQDFFQCGMEPISNYGTTVNEMMLQSNEGKIRVFPAIPSAWDTTSIAFTMLARGAFVVSAERDATAQVTQVGIKSQKGNTCKIQNPWNNEKVTVYQVGDKTKSISHKVDAGNVIEFKTSPSAEYVVCRGDKKPVGSKTNFSGSKNNNVKHLGNRILGKLRGMDDPK